MNIGFRTNTVVFGVCPTLILLPMRSSAYDRSENNEHWCIGSLWNKLTKVCPNLRVEDAGNGLGVVVGLNLSLEG